MAVAPSAFVSTSGLLSASPFPSSSSLAQGGKNVARLSSLDQTESPSSAWGHFMIGCVGAGLVGAAGRRRPKTRGSEQLSRSGAVVANKMEVSTPFPKIDRSKTKEFRKKLMTSDQYFRFSKTQMDQAMNTLKSTSGSDLMMRIRENGFRLTIGDITFVLAESYGFCWGVERTLAMAYEARNFFPDQTIWVTNEIIHNAVVNKELEGKGMRFVPKAADGTKDFSGIKQSDVCILPAFGASVDEMALLKEKGVQIVDATCPWVAKVWNSVEKSKEKGHTSIIHGKYAHEETVATKSFAEKYIVVKDLKQAEYVADYMLKGGKKDEFLKTFEGATSDGFDPDTDLECVGVANQTTMLKGETELIGRLFERVMIKKFGPQNVSKHFISFNTICDATQERQDAMYNLLGEKYIPPSSVVYADLEGEQVGVELQSAPRKGKSLSSKDKEAATRGGVVETSSAPPPRPDLCLVVGGFNSSNTFHLIEIPEEFGIPTYHIDCAARISGNVPGANVIQHKPLSTSVSDAMVEKGLQVSEDFLPAGPVVIGVTAGASTPDSSTAQCLQKILSIRGLTFA